MTSDLVFDPIHDATTIFGSPGPKALRSGLLWLIGYLLALTFRPSEIHLLGRKICLPKTRLFWNFEHTFFQVALTQPQKNEKGLRYRSSWLAWLSLSPQKKSWTFILKYETIHSPWLDSCPSSFGVQGLIHSKLSHRRSSTLDAGSGSKRQVLDRKLAWTTSLARMWIYHMGHTGKLAAFHLESVRGHRTIGANFPKISPKIWEYLGAKNGGKPVLPSLHF